jgi:hypothetical protein
VTELATLALVLACLGLVLLTSPGSADETVLFEEDFEGDLSNWLYEGAGSIALQDGALLMETADEPPKCGVTWCTKRFEGPVHISYDFKPLPEGAVPNACCIFIACATPMQHEHILDWERDGSYGAYAWDHTMTLYTISYRRRPDKGEDFRRCNVRLLGGNTPEEWKDGVGSQAGEKWQEWNRLTMLASEPDHTDYFDGNFHNIELLVRPSADQTQLTMKIDGKVAVECIDRGSKFGGPLSGGWHALRQFSGAQKCLYDNFRVTRLEE